MSVQLAPKPNNEDRRVMAVKRTGIIDSDGTCFCLPSDARQPYHRTIYGTGPINS